MGLERKLVLNILVFITSLHYNAAIGLEEQLQHIMQTRREALGIDSLTNLHSRRSHYKEGTVIGAPSSVHHLPVAEPILPGHTLLRPTIGMLKSAMKFPHREWEDGSGVYGNMDNLGITYKWNQRNLYSKFRRSGSGPFDYIMVQLPSKSRSKYRPKVSSLVLDMDDMNEKGSYNALLLGIMKNIPQSNLKRNIDVYIADLGRVNKKRKMKKKPKRGRRNDLVHNESSIETLVVTEKTYVVPTAVTKIAPDSDQDSDDDDKPKQYMTDKLRWLWSTKNQYDHIAVNQDAPELKNFIPRDTTEKSNVKNWWYFNEMDSVPSDNVAYTKLKQSAEVNEELY